MRKLRLAGLVAALCVFAAALSGGGAAVTPPGTVVMSGLDNPRHLAFGPEGALYVAEAGRGGSGPCTKRKLSAPCPTDEGFRTIEVRESEKAWEYLQAKRLALAIAALGGPARPEPTFRGLRAAHVVVGTAIAEKEAL